MDRSCLYCAALVLLCAAPACSGNEFAGPSAGATTASATGGSGGAGSGGQGAQGGGTSASSGGGGSGATGGGGSGAFGGGGGGGGMGGAAGGGGGGPGPAWPDSSTTFCTDGTAPAGCPMQGDPGDGQDGNYQIVAPQYIIDPDYVGDLITGLTWQRNGSALELSWDEAVAYCDQLSLAGADDWRLASRLEIVSILDSGQIGPSIAPVAFAGTPPQPFWTSTPQIQEASGYAWYLDYGDANLGTIAMADAHYARCVRGQPLAGAFVPVGAGAVRDVRTGLVWEDPPGAVIFSWANALEYCEALVVEGASDWRLPNQKELLSIVLETASTPAIDLNAFSGTLNELYWSSSPRPDYPDHAWGVNFTNGATGTHGPITDGGVVGRVRCVR